MTRRILLILLGLLAFRLILMATTPVFDPSEARYAAISANMVRTGDFVVPHFTYKGVYQSFDGKPPLVFQAGGLFCRVLGVNEFAVRLFPLLSAVLLLVILYATVRREADRETAELAVLICATATAFFAAAGLAMTDMTLTCCVAGALCLYHMRCRWGVAALLGAGMIVKGPVALVLFGLPVFVDACVNHRWREILTVRWLVVAPIFFLVAVPWFVLVEQRNPGSVWYFFYNENFLRFVSHDYGDKYGAGREAFRGVSILWALVACLPWTLLVPLKKPEWKNFFLLSALAITGFWCLTSRVLLYYLFPMIPLFAAYLALKGDRAKLLRFAPACAILSCVVVFGTLVGGMFFSDKMQGEKAAFSTRGSTYSYEFYHGTHPSAIKQ